MPAPKSPVKFIPENFDVDTHCGASTKGGERPCMQAAGFGTDHLGVGRCKFHGGISGTIKHGGYSTVRKAALADRVEQLRKDPELLTLDREIAYLKLVVADDMEAYEEEWNKFNEIQEMIASGEWDEKTMGKPVIKARPQANMILMDGLNRLITNAYNMRFSKRFSVPITELHDMLGEIGRAFDDVCTKYKIPPEARREFGDRVRKLRTSNVGPPPPDGREPDPQLMRAGGEYSARGEDEDAA